MEYKTYPCEVNFRYLILKGVPVVAGFFSEKDAADYALSIGGTVIKANENPRNAGRIPKFSDREKDAIRECIAQRNSHASYCPGIPMFCRLCSKIKM